jgi:hypothetical protein
MVRDLDVRLSTGHAEAPDALVTAVARRLAVAPSAVTHVTPLRRSLDARGRTPVWVLRVRAWIDEVPAPEPAWTLELPEVRRSPPAVVVGAGPAGLFAALRLVEGGVRPIVLERAPPSAASVPSPVPLPTSTARNSRRPTAPARRSGSVSPQVGTPFPT